MQITDSITVAVGATTKTFRVLSAYPRDSVKRLGGETLRSRLYSHVAGLRWSYEITFDVADVVAEAAFFKTLLLANSCTLTVNLIPSATRTKECVLDDGDVPREYIDGIIYLPELKLTFREVERELA